MCWGDNSFGQLGNGTETTSNVPVSVSGLSSGVSAIAAGGYFTCALLANGAVKCWGANDLGELGDGTTTERSTPVLVQGLSGTASALAVGLAHSCAIVSSAVQCWGGNQYAQLGNDSGATSCPNGATNCTFRATPANVQGIQGTPTGLTAGGTHSCILQNTGGMQCWGSNSSGELGDGTTTQRNSAVSVTSFSGGVSGIAAGTLNTCAILTSGSILCWGANGSGQVGDGTTSNRSSPTQVSGLTAGVSSAGIGG